MNGFDLSKLVGDHVDLRLVEAYLGIIPEKQKVWNCVKNLNLCNISKRFLKKNGYEALGLQLWLSSFYSNFYHRINCLQWVTSYSEHQKATEVSFEWQFALSKWRLSLSGPDNKEAGREVELNHHYEGANLLDESISFKKQLYQYQSHLM